jgi:predicted nucleic acid-binding Zn ribbon protein
VLPVQNIAPGVLAEIVRRQPASRARTAFAWSVAVGPALARATTVELRDGVLYVTPRDARWTREIFRARDTILVRLQALLGAGAVTDLQVLDAPAGPGSPASHLDY